MSRFGDELRLEREGQGLSLDALSAETKVNPLHFEALERGQFHELPGGVFRRGILRAYLHSLQLDEAQWMRRFDAELAAHATARQEPVKSPEEAWVAFATNVKKNRTRQKATNGLRWLGVFSLSLAVAAGGWALWTFELRRLLEH